MKSPQEVGHCCKPVRNGPARDSVRERTLARTFVVTMLLSLFMAATAVAEPVVVELGPNVEVVGVAAVNSTATLVVGNRFNTESGFSEGVVFHINLTNNSFTESTVGTFGGDTFLSAVSPNGVYLSGYSRSAVGELFQGFRAEVASPGILTGTGGLGPVPESYAFDVSNSGVVVGTTDGDSIPYRWDSVSGITGLTDPTGGGAFGVSSSGVIVGSLSTAPGEFSATVWNNVNQSFLESPTEFDSGATDISPNGEYIGGGVSFDDLDLFEIINQAAVWHNGSLTRLEDASGNVFEGIVRAVSDNGFAVGESSDGFGFIWHESFNGVRNFNEWLSTEHGINLPSSVTSVQDVFLANGNLYFAANGSAYFVSAPAPAFSVPEPSSIVFGLLTLLAFVLFALRSTGKQCGLASQMLRTGEASGTRLN